MKRSECGATCNDETAYDGEYNGNNKQGLVGPFEIGLPEAKDDAPHHGKEEEGILSEAVEGEECTEVS